MASHSTHTLGTDYVYVSWLLSIIENYRKQSVSTIELKNYNQLININTIGPI